MITLYLPFPPSINTYWRHISKGKLAGRVLISEKGRQYRAEVLYTIGLARKLVQRLEGRLAVEIIAHAPDRRQRDLDNLPKAILDALTHAGVWHDDSQIDLLIVRRGEVVSGGEIVLRISLASAPTCLCTGCGGGESKPNNEKDNNG